MWLGITASLTVRWSGFEQVHKPWDEVTVRTNSPTWSSICSCCLFPWIFTWQKYFPWSWNCALLIRRERFPRCRSSVSENFPAGVKQSLRSWWVDCWLMEQLIKEDSESLATHCTRMSSEKSCCPRLMREQLRTASSPLETVTSFRTFIFQSSVTEHTAQKNHQHNVPSLWMKVLA